MDLGAILIGIDSSNRLYINNSICTNIDNTSGFYALKSQYELYQSFTSIVSNESRMGSDPYHWTKLFQNDDEITMKLNVVNRTLQWDINGKYTGLRCEDIRFDQHTVYQMAISIYGGAATISIIDFKIVSV